MQCLWSALPRYSGKRQSGQMVFTPIAPEAGEFACLALNLADGLDEFSVGADRFYRVSELKTE